MYLRKFGLSLLMAGVLLGDLASARAQTSDTFANLIAGDTLSVGNFTFDQFALTDLNTFSSPLLSQINVSIFTTSNGVGIKYTANPAWTDPNKLGPTLPWHFHVHNSGPGAFAGVTLLGDPSGDPSSDADVHKQIFFNSDYKTHLLASPDLFIGKNSDHHNFATLTNDLYIKDHIDIVASGTGAAPSVSYVEEDFNVAPEGNTLALLGIGGLPLLGFGIRRLRQRK